MRAALVSLVLAVLASPAAAGALDDPPFTAKPAAMLAAARAAAKVDAPVVILRDDVHVTYDDRGRATRTFRLVVVVNKPSAIDDWGTAYVPYSPFYQDKPKLRARVIAPDGKVSELDPSLLQDTATEVQSAVIFSDRRVVMAPLPRLAIGAVLEEEFVVADREPMLAAGTTQQYEGGRAERVERMSVTIDAPTRLGVRVVARGFARPPVPRKTTKGGRTTWTYVVDAPTPLALGHPSVPPDVAAVPYIGVATAPSWSAVAAGYDALVAPRLAAPLALPAGVAAATPRATLDQALAWLHTNVRYTGIELGDSEIVPAAPPATIGRGFGDAKDRAAVLVSMLRAAKMEAHLALLFTGPGTDADLDLPGMGAFDHVIVRARVDGKDVWIDPAEDDLPAGQLPPRAQGRRTLIVAPGTRDLVMTPVGAPADNLVREVRTYHLAELDGARLTEVTREHGLFRDNLREWIREGVPAEIRKDLGAYVERQYHGKLVRVDAPVPAKATDPFDMTLEIENVKRAYTDRTQIDVYLFASDTFGRLADSIRRDDEEADALAATRPFDYVFSTPHVYEVENRLVIPPGYEAPAELVPREEQAVGSMKLTTTRRLDGNTLVITYRLDTGKTRITPAELRATRAAVQRHGAADGEHVLLPQTGARLIEEGKLVEAVKEYQRLIALHPREALHHTQLAEAYRRAGLVLSARRTARKAIAVEPGYGDAHALLGFHLSHDAGGRAYGPGFDRAGAIAAYRKALVLTPEHVGAITDLASVLAVDDQGWPTTSARDLREAAALLERVRKLDEDDDHLATAAGYLLRAGDLAEAERVARLLPAGEPRAAILVAAATATKGAPEGIALGGRLASGDARTRVLNGARAWLYTMRRYDAMRALLKAVPENPDDAAYRGLLDSIQPVDQARLDPADPKTPGLLMMASFFGVQPASPPWAKDVGAEVYELGIQGARASGADSLRDNPLAVALDSVLSAVSFSVDGDAASGWRVTMDASGGKLVMYVARGPRGAEVLAVEGAPGGFGRQILLAVAKKDLPGARRWLERVTGAAIPTPTFLLVKALAASEGSAAASRDVLELSGALLVAEMDPAAAIPILRRCKTTHAPTVEACRETLIDALAARKAYDDIPPLARQLPTSTSWEVVTRARHLALGDAGAEALELLDAALVKSPDDRLLVIARAFVTVEVEGWKAAEPWFTRAAANQGLAPSDLNNLAWTRLYYDATPDEARTLADRAAAMRPMSEHLAHTRATIAAHADDPHQALTFLASSHRRLPWEPRADADWYVLGRIAETYNLRDDAIAYYRMVTPSDPSPGQPTTYDYARKALTRLGAKP